MEKISIVYLLLNDFIKNYNNNDKNRQKKKKSRELRRILVRVVLVRARLLDGVNGVCETPKARGSSQRLVG